MSVTNRETAQRPGEVVFALLLIVGSVTVFWQSFAISGLRGLSEPGVFPMLASAAMMASSVLIFKDVITSSPPEQGQSSFLTEVLPIRLLFMVGLIILYVVAMPLIGFVYSSSIFLFASFWLLWRKGPLVSAALTAVSLAIVYLVFRLVFQVVLPSGSLVKGII